MKVNNPLLKIALIYIYMNYVGPCIWGFWMVYKLRIITLQEFSHSLISPIAITLFVSYFLFNLLYMRRVLCNLKTSCNLNHGDSRKNYYFNAMKVHCISLLTFGTIGTAIFMSLLVTKDPISMQLLQSVRALIAITGSIAGASLVFLFYSLFSVFIFTIIVGSIKTIPFCDIKKTLLTLKTFNFFIYIIGLVLFVGASIASIILKPEEANKIASFGQVAFFSASIAFPIFMSSLFYLKSIKKIKRLIQTEDPNVTLPSGGRVGESNLLKVKFIVQILFLIGFFGLLLISKIQFWLAILIMGVCMSFIIGRVYCGWCCPVNGMNRLVVLLYKLVPIKRRSTPVFFQSKFFRTIWFALLLGLVIFSAITGKQFSMFTVITIMGVLVSTIFTSSLWCIHLCPWAIVFRIANRYPIRK